MEDPDYVPNWGDEDYSKGDEDNDGRPRKRQRRSKTPEIPDFDWKSHYEKMKQMAIEPPTGIAGRPIKIAAFNIQVFGEKKLKKTDVSKVLVKILRRYDLILIQEIRDSSDTALDNLVRLVSQVDPDDPFATVVSERLGRTNSKEQYAFMFRTSRIAVAETFQFDDGEDNGQDVFQREPFAVRFFSPYTDLKYFGIIAIHTQPDHAIKEIDALVKVYDCTKKKWNLADIMIAGDFNADEGYVHRDDWQKIALRNDRRFKWMIDDDTDTTVGNTDRAYDRFVVAGKGLTQAIVPGSNQVYRFDEALGLTSDEAEDVSDHYPIEIELRGIVNYDLQANLSSNVSITVKQKKPIDSDKMVRKIYRTTTGEDSAFFDHTRTYDNNSMFAVTAMRRDVEDVVKALQEFQNAFPGVVFDETIDMVSKYMESSAMKVRPLVYGLVGLKDGGDGKGSDKFDISVYAKIEEPLECSVTISRPMS